jgi:hypothetical protein
LWSGVRFIKEEMVPDPAAPAGSLRHLLALGMLSPVFEAESLWGVGVMR